MYRERIIKNFLNYLSNNGVSSSSLRFYKSDIVNFLNWANGRKVNKVLVNEYINSQRLITPISTLNRRLSTIRSFASYLGDNFMDNINNVNSFKKVTKSWQEAVLTKFESKPKIKNAFSKLFFNRPNWYRKYHSYAMSSYIHFAILVLFASTTGYATYDQFFSTTNNLFAFPSALTRPNRYLSFQGRLTDDLGNPETVATNVVFKLYDVATGGTELWDSGTCSITPDQDGIFSTLLGSSCGTEIASSVFSENAAIWLGVTVGTDSEATPRIQIATVAYALNAETLQGFPAGTGASTIPYINSSGIVVLANASPKIQSTSGTFAVEGQALTLTTPDTSNGSITINPDGTGTLNLTFEGASAGGGANGFVNATNANITSGSLYSGTVASNATGYYFINFLSGASPTSKFSIDSTGLTNIGADLYVASGISTFGTAVSDGTIEATKFCTGDGETNCVTDFSSLSGGGSSVWSDLLAPTANLSLNHTTYTTAFDWATGTGTDNLFSLTTANSSDGTGSLLNLQTGTSSTVSPLRVRAGATEALFVDNVGKVGIGTSGPDARLESLATSGEQLRLTYTDSSVYSGFTTDSNGYLIIDPTGARIALDGALQVGGTTPLGYSRLGTATTSHAGNITAANDLLISSDLEVDGTFFLDGGTIANSTGTASIILSSSVTDTPNTLSASNWLVENTANVGQAALMINNTKSGDLLTASASGTTKFTVQNDGDVLLTNQLQLGNLASAPTALGGGSMFFNTTTNTNQCYNGTNWYNCGGTLYSNTNNVADGAYITVSHNLANSDLLSNAWIDTHGNWKLLDATYKPAIAWEGKDTQKGVYHNNINTYIQGSETGAVSASLNEGLVFDTFEDSTKTDSANTTVSTTAQMGDDGSANYSTLNQRIQSGRVGLMGGQTYSTSTTDNDGQTYLGSNTVNDIFYYDRAKDSIPEVLVELGIDPNWYNGVTLSVATSSASYSQNGTLADKNPNLTTSYNGSLIKATGTDTTPRTIYITIKSPTTFDWTNYQGDAATGVTITPGTAQTLGSTGVSATFTATNYNVGDVFKIASWYIEPAGSTRGAKRQFPERSYIITQNTDLSIIDADTQKLWMHFDQGSNFAIGGTTQTLTAAEALNGQIYVSNLSTGIYKLSLVADNSRNYQTDGEHQKTDALALRNTSGSSTLLNSSLSIVTLAANDVAAAVIPNKPTQEVTVSGWGYIPGNGANPYTLETVPLPYKFNSKPNVTIAGAGSKASTTPPLSLTECNGETNTMTSVANVDTNNFTAIASNDDGTVLQPTWFYCYTWTATGTVSPKQFVAVATGATSTDGGTTIINETDGTKADVLNGALTGNTIWSTKVAIANNTLYSTWSISSPGEALAVYKNVHGLESESAIFNRRNGQYGTFASTSPWHPRYIGTSPAADVVKSLTVTPSTSTIDSNSNTLYIGTDLGVTVINENQGKLNRTGTNTVSSEEAFGSVKYYTKDYISEEMIGDVRGMWPLNNANASSDFEDVSVKGNHLTGTNITANGDSVSGVRNTATDFDGSTEYMSCTDAACGGTTKLDLGASTPITYGTWFKTSATPGANQFIFGKKQTAGGTTDGYALYTNNSYTPICSMGDGATGFSATSPMATNDGIWHHAVCVSSGTGTLDLYIDGQKVATGAGPINDADNTYPFTVGASGGATAYFNGAVDEVFVTATALTAGQIKNMYQVGYRALQSHGTGLGSGGADTNQQLGGTTNTIGVVAPDYNNQYMYVGTNSTTAGALSKIQLNSDTNIKTYNSSANVPAGGSLLIDEDVTSLAVGETLLAAGSATTGVKSMGFDDYSTATSGNYVSKTFELPKNIGSAVLWVSPVLDSNDGSNTITIQASNDGGSNYVTCTLVGTDSNRSVPEREYACTFATADNDLKVRFQFARGSTKTNTYVTEYGISWLGETGFRVEQADNNNVRLYNFSGETQNLKLNVTGASTAALANPWTDAGSYLYATGYETLRIYDGAGTNYLGLSHDGTLANLTYNGTTVLSINSTGDLLPDTDDTQNLGSDTKRWKDLYLGGETIHIGNSLTDEATIAYDTTNNIFQFDTDTTTNGDIAFFTNQLYLDKSSEIVGIGTTSPIGKLTVAGVSANRFAIDAITDPSGRGIRINTTDYVDSTTGSSLRLTLGAGTGDTYSAINARTAGNSAAGNLILQDGGGNVGIGTTAPATKLDVTNSVSGNLVTFFGYNTSGTANTESSSIQLGRGSTKPMGEIRAGNTISGNFGQGYLSLLTRTSESMTEKMRIDQNGNVGIGSTTPNNKLEVKTTDTTAPIRLYNDNSGTTQFWSVGPVSSDNFVIFNGASTGMYMAHGATAWTANSDERLKTNISPIASVEGIQALMQLNPIDYNWKDINTNQSKQTGFIAQEVQRLFPGLVSLGETTTITLADGSAQTIETPLGVNYTGFIPYIIKGIQEQQTRIDNLFQSGIASIQNFIAPSIDTNIISPIANSDLIIDLSPEESASRLVIKGVNDQEVASIDATGKITANSLQTTADATISGTLYADNIESQRLEDIEELLREVELNQGLLAESQTWDTNTSADSAEFASLIASSLQTNDLFVTGQAAISSLFISDLLTTNKIESLDMPLQIQSLAAAPLEIMAGKIIIDTNGNTKFLGNVEIAGDLKINNLIVANNIDPVATESGSIIEGQVVSNSTAGKAVLKANSESIVINNNKVSLNTLIYITPITSTQNKVLFVKSKDNGYFEVGFSDTLETDVEFNWWIIDLEDNTITE